MRFPFFLLHVVVLLWYHQHVLVSAQQEVNDDFMNSENDDEDHKGPNARRRADVYMAQHKYEQAATEYWNAVLFHTQTPASLTYDVQEAFGNFFQAFQLQGRSLADAYAFVALESFRRQQRPMGEQFLQQALANDPNNEAALSVQQEYGNRNGNTPQSKPTASSSKPSTSSGTSTTTLDASLQGKTPEELYAMASHHFAKKEFEDCADLFELSCQLSGETLGPSCANAVYCRTMILDWGFNGTQFDADMQRIVTWTRREARTLRQTRHPQPYSRAALSSNQFAWQRTASVHPHMMLGYPLPGGNESLVLKRFVAEATAFMDEMMARLNQDTEAATKSYTQHNLPPLPNDLPYSVNPDDWRREKYQMSKDKDYKIRVGFVGSGFNSKAVLYLSHDMFRFFDASRFEIHIFAFNPPDHAVFLEHGMRGVDWRKRVQSNVDHFHDLQHLVNDHIEAARYIRSQSIHILIEWDGYARQGERAQGLFGLRPAPLQMLHQEYLGTSGALHVDYLFTDAVTSPPDATAHLFTEKLIYLPNHFFSKGHALQSEVHRPSHTYTPRSSGEPYRLGTGTPQQNKCLSSNEQVSFVFCNWNKMLKNNPETVRSWIHILRQVPNSILCLLENPTSGVEYFRKFVHEAAGTLQNNDTLSNPYENFVAGDGDDLNARIHFLSWEKNPFDYQRRNVDFCNVMLDSWPYNGHTVAQDALYAGVPIVTRSDGWEMSSRVTTSANIVLGLDAHLNAYQGPTQYQDLAIALATNQTLFQSVRSRLIDTALQRNPMHPYWDVPRYVKNFEQGLQTAWDRFLDGEAPENIYVHDAGTGTMDEEIAAHPPMGPHTVEE